MTRFEDWQQPTYDERGMTKWQWRVIWPERLILEKDTDIGSFCLIQAEYGVTIFEGAQVGSHCSIYSVNSEDDTRGPVQIGRFARIGTHSTILPNVTIHDGAVVGAYSLVKTDIPAHTLAYGIPTKIIRKL